MSEAVSFTNSELGKRVFSAIVLLIIILGASWIGGIPFLVMCLALSGVMYWEWQKMVRQTAFDSTEMLLTAGFICLILGSFTDLLPYAIVGFLALGLTLELISRGNERSDVRWIGLGALYCAIPAITFPFIREQGGFATLMFVCFVVWVTDVGAYFAGRAIGGPKLLPAVSPKKTWSGALGGLFAALIIGIVFVSNVHGFGAYSVVILAVILSVVSQAGDLFESWVKRLFGVKDSSNLIPGHGGFLDRLDGLVAAAVPMATLVATNAF